MANGTDTHGTNAQPLRPANGYLVQQQTASSAVDIMTVQAASSGTGDYVVYRNSSETEIAYLTSDGGLNFVGAAGARGVILGKTGTGQTTFAKLRLPILSTAPASAGLTKGDVWLALATADVLRLAVCISTATGAARYGGRIIRTTLGTASH
jgi:hypothetical protein